MTTKMIKMDKYLRTRSNSIAALTFVLATMSGCTSSGSDNFKIVEISPNVYMVASNGESEEYVSRTARAIIDHKLRAFCFSRDLVMHRVKDNTEDSNDSESSHAVTQFRCLPK